MTIHRIGPHTLATAAAPVDVLLTHGFFMALDPKQASKARPYPPLSTLQLAALLRGQQLSVAVFDAMLAADESAFAAALAAARPRLVILQEDNFNFLSKMCLGRMREAALNLVRMGRAAGLPVLVNGSDASDHPEVYLAAGATGVARGEGDWTLLEAARSILDAATGTSPWPIEQGSDEPLLPAGLSVMVADRRVDGLPRPVER
ncbi:MAG TPA: Mg-protoporphyrin IX monomethyl ester oxidative cyclase, partial [Anaerolineae bacterium]|nr:Mg-protoporphyrin IX monomethyl ester oxidative cyclase [Anaerolineae bacterium]